MTALQSALKDLLLDTAINGKTAQLDSAAATAGVLSATANPDAPLGAFKVWVDRLASATTARTSTPGGAAAAVGRAVDPGNADGTGTKLKDAGLAIPVTAGSFSLNGKNITVDPTVDTLTQVVNRINATAGVGVAASLNNDVYGRPNMLQLVSTNGQVVQLGATSDTSNFLAAMSLVANGTTTVASARPLGAVLSGNPLSAARWDRVGAIAASGTVTINGVNIAWSNSDTLVGVLNRINGSAAGVRATYDAATDRVAISNVATGNQAIALSDTSGNLLQALGVYDPGTNTVLGQTYGATAQYSIDDHSVARYSNSNTIADAVPGVTLNLLQAQAAGAAGVQVTVSQDVAGATKKVQAFVDAFNGALNSVSQATAYNSATKKGSVLTGDSAIQGLAARLRSMVSDPAFGVSGKYKALADIGISTGAYGSKVGTTSALVLDTQKLTAALQDNPSAVNAVVAGLTAKTTLNPDGSGNPTPGNVLSSVTGLPTGEVFGGTYSVSYDPVANTLSSVFTPTGGTPRPATSITPTAGGSDGSLIFGLTLTTKNPLPGAPTADTINYTVTSRGVARRLDAQLRDTLGIQGLFDAEATRTTREVAELDKRIDAMNQRVDLRRATLQRQFTALEVAMTKLQGQSAKLSGSLAQLGQTRGG
jgi:flagellar hook-associated protein 2